MPHLYAINQMHTQANSSKLVCLLLGSVLVLCYLACWFPLVCGLLVLEVVLYIISSL